MRVNQQPAEPDAGPHGAAGRPALARRPARRARRREYQGARGARFAIFPGSALARRPPAWVMVAELVETSRLWGRIAARIEPEWVEPLAEHLVRRTYSEPRWDAQARAGRRDRARHPLRPADRHRAHGRRTGASTRRCRASCSSAARWWRATGRPATSSSPPTGGSSRRCEALEERARRRDILVSDEVLFDFFDERDPRRRRLRRALRPLVARRAPRRPRAADATRARCSSARTPPRSTPPRAPTPGARATSRSR